MDCSLPGSSVHGIIQQEYRSGSPCPPPGELPDPGIKTASPMSPALAVGLFATGTTWEALQLSALDPVFWVHPTTVPVQALFRWTSQDLVWGEQRPCPLAGSSRDLELKNTMIVFAPPATCPLQTFPFATWPFQDVLFHGQIVLRVRKSFLWLS